MSILYQMTGREYARHPAIRASYLKKIYTHSVWHADQPMSDSPAFLLGNAIHSLLAGDDHEVVVPPDFGDAVHTVAEMKAALSDAGVSGYSKWKRDDCITACRDAGIQVRSDIEEQWARDNEDRYIVTQNQYQYARRAADLTLQKLRDSTTADGVPLAPLLAIAHPEVSVFADDPESDILIKVRPDVLCELDAGFVIISWKTCRAGEGGPHQYARVYRWRHYDLADALYIDTIERASDKPVLAVINVVIEKHGERTCDATALSADAIGIYETSPEEEIIERGRAKYRIALYKLMSAKEGGEPGYPVIAQRIHH